MNAVARHHPQRGLSSRAWLLSLSLGSGCAQSSKTTEIPGPKITQVEIEGLGELEKSEVLKHISLQPSQWLGDTYYYFPGIEPATRERLVQLYHAQGYYDAKVNRIHVQVSNPDKAMIRQWAKIRIQIDPGAPTIIQHIRWVQTKAFSATSQVPEDLRATAKLKVGQRFSISRFNTAKRALRKALNERGYPEAEVKESAWVDKKSHHARLAFHLLYGPQVTITSARVKGVRGSPQKFIQKLASAEIGQVYSPKRIATLESSIYALGIASSVHTRLNTTAHAQHRSLLVDIALRDPSQLAIGATAHFDSTIWSQQLGFRYQHNNLFRRLAKLKLRLAAGWAEMPASEGPWHSSPLLEVDAHLSKPSLQDPKLRWFAQVATSTQPREGYELWRAQGKLGALRNIGNFASVALSYNASWLSIYTFSSRRKPTTQSIDAIEGTRPFLSFLEAELQAFHLDQRLAPKQGVHALLTYQWASRFLGSQSEYHRVVPELRGYYHPLSWLVIAARTRLGFILPFGRAPGARIDQRFYLGGVGSMRGWPLRSLSPFVRLCDSDENCQAIPIGGNSEFLANLELRFNVWRALDLVAFADAGDVQTRVFTTSPRNWMYTSGGGLRYVTPIGAIRLDVGVQLNHDRQRFRPTRGFAIHLALGDSF